MPAQLCLLWAVQMIWDFRGGLREHSGTFQAWGKIVTVWTRGGQGVRAGELQAFCKPQLPHLNSKHLGTPRRRDGPPAGEGVGGPRCLCQAHR